MWLSNSKIPGFAAVQSGNMEGERVQPFMELFEEDKYHWIADIVAKREKL